MKTKMNYKRGLIKVVFTTLILLLFFTVTNCEKEETQTVATFTNLVLQDEFNTDGAPNSGIWNYEIGDGSDIGLPGWGNNELQYYTDRTENIKVENGYLLISAIEESFDGSSYTSARIITKGKFEQAYGRFEARIRMPYGQGIWPAFWLLGDDANGEQSWPDIGEIDIVEYLGNEPTKIFGTVHGPGYSGGESISKSYTIENDRFDTGFHVFGIEWGPDYINHYVDGNLYNQITPADVPGEWVFNKPFYIIINLAVGGELPGAPNEETVFPQTMLVDYVRVYQQQQQ